MITVSRSEIEKLQRWQDDEEIANNCYEDDEGCFILYDDLRALLNKAESQVEPVATISISDNEPWGYVYKIELNDKSNSNPEWNTWVINTFGGIGQFNLFTSPPADKQDACNAKVRNAIHNQVRKDNGCGQLTCWNNSTPNDCKCTNKAQSLIKAIDQAMKGK